MEIKAVGQNFGMAMVKTKSAERFIICLPYDKAIEVKVMEMESRRNPIDYYVSTINKNGKEKIAVEVGTKKFVQNILRNPIKTIRAGKEYAEKLNAEQQSQKELTSGMTIPKI